MLSGARRSLPAPFFPIARMRPCLQALDSPHASSNAPQPHVDGVPACPSVRRALPLSSGAVRAAQRSQRRAAAAAGSERRDSPPTVSYQRVCLATSFCLASPLWLMPFHATSGDPVVLVAARFSMCSKCRDSAALVDAIALWMRLHRCTARASMSCVGCQNSAHRVCSRLRMRDWHVKNALR